MRGKSFALMLAAALLAGSIHTAWAEDAPLPQDDPALAEESAVGPDGWRRGNFRGWRPGDRRGDFGPGRGRRDDDRGPRRHMDRPDWGRGPGPRGRFGGPGRHFGGMGMGIGHGIDHRMFGELDLTAEQKAKLVDVLTDNYRAKLEAGLEMMDAGRKLRDLGNDETASGEAIVEASAAAGAARGKLEVLRRQLRIDIEKVLTPEQVKKLEDRRPGFPPPPPGDRKFEDRRPGPGPRGPGRPGNAPKPRR